jgi:hypothetical protein
VSVETVEVAVQLTADARTRAGVLLVALVAVEYGGTFMLKVSRGRQPASALQQSFFRAGHAHAGVLVVLALVCQLYLSAARLDGVVHAVAGQGVALAAILMPAGFFLSVVGKDVTRPNRLVVLIWLGAASLAAGVLALGAGLLVAG